MEIEWDSNNLSEIFKKFFFINRYIIENNVDILLCKLNCQIWIEIYEI